MTDSTSRRQKVAIPRLDRGAPAPPESRDRNKESRIGRACKNCRKRKVKCSGDIPTCKNCGNNNIPCVYEQARRDRLKDASNLNHTLVVLLRDLQHRVDHSDALRIDNALNNAEADLMSPSASSPYTTLDKRDWKASAEDLGLPTRRHGEVAAAESAEPERIIGHLDDDLMRTHESRQTGLVGQNSEIQWLRSIQPSGNELAASSYSEPGYEAMYTGATAIHNSPEEARHHPKQGSMAHVTDFSFYLDSSVIDVDFMVDPHGFPEPDQAEKLFNCYFDTVHSSFPLVPTSFENQFRRYMSSIRNNHPFLVQDKWRAHLNLLFAIGAKYSHLIGAPWRGDERDHLIYMTRAIHLLGLKNTIMVISGPDLELVRAMGTLAFYFLVIGHVSRAWVMIGVSLRLAVSLGLHLRNEEPSIEQSRKNTLAQAWWSLHSIECIISMVTGRPSSIPYEDCTVPPPCNQHDKPQASLGSLKEHAKSFQGSHTKTAFPQSYVGHVSNTIISQKALLNLYSPRTASKPWDLVQCKIEDMLLELEDWSRITFNNEKTSRDGKNFLTFDRQRFLLQVDYWSTKILITRPCLCRVDSRTRDNADGSQSFNAKTAEACVEAALQMASLFPHEPDLNFIYDNGPWWTLVHFIMQAIAVLLLDLAYKSEASENENGLIIISTKRLISWLQTMQRRDAVAANALQVIRNILNSSAPSLQAQAAYLLSEQHEPLSDLYNQQLAPQDIYQQIPMPNANGTDHAYYHGFYDGIIRNPYAPYQDPSLDLDQTASPLFGNAFYTNNDQDSPMRNHFDREHTR